MQGRVAGMQVRRTGNCLYCIVETRASWQRALFNRLVHMPHLLNRMRFTYYPRYSSASHGDDTSMGRAIACLVPGAW